MSNYDKLVTELEKQAYENLKILHKSEEKIDEELSHFYSENPKTSISTIEEYKIIVEKEKCIAKLLSKMKVHKNGVLLGQVFVPTEYQNFFKNHI